MTDTLAHFINGERVSADAPVKSINPSDTRDVVAMAPEDDGGRMNEAVDAARAAFPAWSDASPEVRADVLDKAGEIIIRRKDEIGRLLAREEGKTVPEGTGETVRAARILKYFAGEALRRHGQFLDSTRPGVEASTMRQAVGVIGQITPWNFPIAIPAWKAAPALAFGNTVVMKPSEYTPATASVLADALAEAGAPKGVFNMVFASGAGGATLSGHPGVDALSFTGSQSTGAKVAQAAVQRQARVQLEMGGKNPLVVLDDADLDRAVMCALDGAFFSTGQRCTASSRILVADGIHDRFVEALAAKVKALRVGDALDPQTQIGPVASQMQLDKVMSYLDIAAKEGARCMVGGDKPDVGKPGFYVSPTLLVDTHVDMRVNCEEIFGPVATVVRVKDYEDALQIANSGDYGLSAGIVTTSLKHATHFKRHARAGMVMVNLPTAGVDYHVPFGGTKKSSYGPREQGFSAVEFYTQIKTVYSWA